MRHLLTLLLIIGMAATTPAHAQDDPEYRMEIGVGTGLSGYLGDFNGSLTHGLRPMASAVVRRVINPYMALRLNLATATMKGSSDDVETHYPDYAETPYTFSNKIYDLGLTYEYNFWPYGTGRDYRGARRLTPFVYSGLGLTYIDSSTKGKVALNIPLGLGVKYKVAERVNLGLEWAMHFAQTDELDGVKDPYHVKSSGLLKNTDCFSTLQLTLTYSFMQKCKTCNKE